MFDAFRSNKKACDVIKYVGEGIDVKCLSNIIDAYTDYGIAFAHNESLLPAIKKHQGIYIVVIISQFKEQLIPSKSLSYSKIILKRQNNYENTLN